MLQEMSDRLPLGVASIKAQTDSMVVRWSVLAMAVIAIWVWVVEPIAQWSSNLAEEVERDARKTARMLALEEHADTWLRVQQEGNEVYAKAVNGLFAAASATQAQADLQQQIRVAAELHGLNIVSQKLIPAVPLPPIGIKLAVEMAVRGELAPMLTMLDDISRAEKLLVIERWSIQIDRRGKASARFTIAGISPRTQDEVDPDA